MNLVAAAKNGNKKAFRGLWSNVTSKDFLRCAAHYPDAEDAEDVVQQSFQKAFTICGSLRGDPPFPPG